MSLFKKKVEQAPAVDTAAAVAGDDIAADIEEHLQASRRLYNADVSEYNQAIVTFPGSIVANSIHATAAEFFKADEAKREDVKMSF